MKKEYATHHGRNVKRLREIMGVKQEALAIELGSEWNQKKISALESRPEIDEDLLERIANVFKVPVEAIENFDDEATVNIVANTFTSHDNSTLNAVNPYCTFNPFDKMLELMEENKKLYERLLQEKDAMIGELKELVKGR
ncbi:helix-turn-helix transcriptional regulator [Chitinophagaceae bacterium MMS25-I14]